MKVSTLLAIAAAAAVSAAPLAPRADEVAEPEKFLLKLSETEERWVTEEEKWELKKVCNISFASFGFGKTTKLIISI